MSVVTYYRLSSIHHTPLFTILRQSIHLNPISSVPLFLSHAHNYRPQLLEVFSHLLNLTDYLKLLQNLFYLTLTYPILSESRSHLPHLGIIYGTSYAQSFNQSDGEVSCKVFHLSVLVLEQRELGSEIFNKSLLVEMHEMGGAQL